MADGNDTKRSKTETSASASVGTCPICSRSTLAAFRPFCSRRCADVDLSRWLNGAYSIPVVDADDDEDGEATDSHDAEGRPRRPIHDA
jgi:uncharacterized protein